LRSQIPFNKPHLVGKESVYIEEAHRNGILAGDGPFTASCHKKLVELTDSKKVLLAHSCTAALEMAAILIDIKPGDEVIMPSYTFVSTANAFVLRGGIPVFVDIRSDTLNLDENLIEDAITPKTKAIVPVHYAGVSCEMEKILTIAKKYDLIVIEDAAQSICSRYKGKSLGSLGDLACMSFHETKNIHCGEGGALLINNPKFAERAEIIREKGTNRTQFFRGQVDKYRWVDIGSSYLPGELVASFLFAQLEEAESITKERIRIWNTYHELFQCLEKTGKVRRPIIPVETEHNGHIYYLLIDRSFDRDDVLEQIECRGINAVFHYQPLHASPAGMKYGSSRSALTVTEEMSECIIRLPLWIGFDQHRRVLGELSDILAE
jgi:dTDP-4-amino-4,6-dideoxygalactose transaminase